MPAKKISSIMLISALFIIIVLFINFLWRTNCGVSEMKVVNGYLDLSNKEIKENIYALDGQWEITFDKEGNHSLKQYIEVPGTWEAGTYGTATYRMNVKLPEKGRYGLYVGMICNAYRLQINGEEVFQNGVVGENLQEEQPKWKYQIVPFYIESNEAEIVIEVSNYHLLSGGIADNILIGDFEKLQTNFIKNALTTAITIGIFLGLGCYMLLLFSMQERNKAYLYLSLHCISQAALELIINECVIYYIIPNISFEAVYKLQFLAYIGEVMALGLFIKTMYPRQRHKKLFIAIMSCNMIYTVLILVMPIVLVTHIAGIYIVLLVINIANMLIYLIEAVYKKENYAWLILSGTIILLFTVSIDFIRRLYGLNAFSGIRNYVYGQLFLLVCQMYLVYKGIEDAFDQSTQAKNMEIAFLQAQIAPHFFFNTLNNIYNMMGTSVTKAQALILDFCDFLRVKHKFDYRKNPMYSLKEEIELLQAYIRIENTRLNGLLELEINVDEALSKVMVPQLVLQPIAENAIKHGFYGKKLIISITCLRKEDKLDVSITDNGKGMAARMTTQILNPNSNIGGIGLKNVNYRLEKYYGTKMTVTSRENEGTSITFQIPLGV